MSPAELLAQLARRGVVIWADGERLRYRAPEAEVDATLRAQMQAQRGGLMQLLQHDPGAMQLTYPLSDGQRALWFLYRLDPASTAYNTMLAARVRAEVYSGALRQALADLARRHLVLRSTYSAGEAGATQHVHEHAQVTLIEADGSEWSDAQTQRWLLAQARQPFDLQRGPVWRAALVRTSERESTLLLVVHHIAVDVLSYMVLAEELRVLYAAAREGARAVLAAVEVDYRDYVLWQTQWLRGQQAELQWSYWRKQLAGELPILDLPTDRPRPPVQTYGGASHRFGLEAALVRGLQSLAGRERATLDDALLAGFALLLHRYSGQAQIVIGSPATGRTEARFAQVVGFFANPVVLRLDVASEESFATLLERVRRTSLDARAHQDYPFSQLVQRLQPQRDPSRSPLFQVAFTVDKAHWTERLAQSGGPAQARDGLQLVPLPMPEQEGQFDLALQIIEQGGNVSGYLKYNTDLFDAATVEGFGVDYVRLLEAAVGRPDVPVWTLELLSGVQREALLGQGRGQRRELGAGGLVHALFEVQARAAPQRTALVYAGQSLSYGELDARANQVAHALRALGVRREMRVGVCVERSLEMVVGLLGVLKAGGAYVPLDPAHPRERLALMLQDAGVGVVLTQRSLVERLPQAGVQVKCLDESWEEMVRAARTDPELEQGPQDLAYVMYTSGSTGRPKGVQVEHAAVVNLLESMAREPGMGSDDVLLAVTNLSFDIAGLELFLPLAVGGQVVVATSEACSDGAKLARLLSQSGATLMQATPVTWRLLLGSGWKGQAGLKLLCGGEALSRELAEALLATGAQVWNLYGPTETTIWSTLQRVVSAQGAVPIGRALANTRLYVLDAQRQLVPAGVWGELYIGGCGVARGYLEQAQLSAERFVEDLFEPGQRMYRTGDWVRWRRDGALEYRGRMDEQVKLRGYRIELGEIESLLAGHPGVREAVVVVRSDGTGEGRLVAYVVLGGEESVLGELGPYLRGKLPAYMVPGVFVPIERLPVTANGKLDRRGLPDPVGVRAQPAAAYEAPRTPLEQLLAHTYAQVLGLERVGLHDNFFEIGGHSLLAMQIHSRLHSARLDLPLHALFEAPSVAQLAALLESPAAAPETGPALEPVSRPEKIPLSFAQERLWVLEQLTPGTPAYNFPLAFRLTGALDREALERSFAALVQRHEALRTTIQSPGGKPFQSIAPAARPRLEVLDLRTLPVAQREAEALRRMRRDARTPFPLERGPLLRTLLIRLSEDEHWVQLTVHHVVADGWSMGVLVSELTLLYGAGVAGLPSPLPPLPLQYADYALWQRRWLQGEVRARQLEYWQQQLAGELPVLQLPGDRPRPAVQSYRGARHRVPLPRALTDALGMLAQREGATVFMALLSGFGALLSRYCGQTDVIVGTPSANRNRREIEDLIGLFLNMLVLRIDVSGEPSFRELLGRVRRVALGAYTHQDMPFEQLVEALRPPRDRSRTPLFQVAFTLQNVPQPALALTGLTVQAIDIDTATSKFDLSVSIADDAQGSIATWEYNTDLFDAATVEGFGVDYVRLLEAAVGRPDVPVWTLELLSGVQREALLGQGRGQRRELGAGGLVHALFEVQARAAPQRTALVYAGQSLSYGELDARANQVAHALRALGVRREMRVGVCVERSLEMVVGLLGVLKAGGAYVPLDPAHPRERLALMLQDAGVGVVLTQRSLVERLPQAGVQVKCLDESWEEMVRAARTDPELEQGPQDLAYVMYTSGSTGRPKGVQVEHAAVVNLLESMAREPGMGSDDVLLAVTNLSFDIAGLELFLPLAVGGQVVVATSEACSDGAKLARLLSQSGATLMQATPVTWRLLLGSGWKGQAGLKLLCGGEALSRELAEALLATGAQVWNLYGPTETTIWSTLQRVVSAQGAVPIGRALANTRLYVLDAQRQLVPAGVWGELYIGGCGVARGYLEQAQLSAERFVEDLFEPGQRMYRTGDWVRWRRDGALEYRGRMDEQVKLRGYRIELGEIESLLAGHPGVREAVVVVRSDGTGEGRLVAYVVLGGEESVLGELGPYLRGKLPAYMVPGVFVPIERLPVTANGKLDRRGLPDPVGVRAQPAAAYEAPRTPLEQLLAHTYAQVLGLERVGLHDNFFEIGGASLASLEITGRLHEAGVPIPAEWIFEHQSIAQLAAAAQSAAEQIGLEPSAPGHQRIGA